MEGMKIRFLHYALSAIAAGALVFGLAGAMTAAPDAEPGVHAVWVGGPTLLLRFGPIELVTLSEGEAWQVVIPEPGEDTVSFLADTEPELATAPARLTVTFGFGRGLLDVTDRQAFQFHWLRIQDIPEILERLDTVGLHTRGACGDTVRAVIASPLAGLDAREKIDVRPLARSSSSSPRARALGPPPTKSRPRMKACARPSGLGCWAKVMVMPSWLPSPRSRSNCSASCGVVMTRMSRMPAIMSVESG